MSPSPTPRHMVAAAELYVQLRSQLPATCGPSLMSILTCNSLLPTSPAPPAGPTWSWSSRPSSNGSRKHGGLLRAASTVLVVEIVSPGSRRTDNLVKRGEYADAGIPAYWIIDAEAPISLVACHLAGAFGYQDRGAVTGAVRDGRTVPESAIDLDALG